MTDIGDLKGATTPDGHYAMYERRGRGNFGTVYRGRDQYLERDVAVKFIHEEETTLDATLTEARIQALCAHPNVVSIYDVRIEPPIPMIVMEYVPAGSAEDRIKDGVALVDSLRWTRNALQGLAHAHGLGILHRDLKPGNVMLLTNGEAALSDFGIAEDTIRGRVATDRHYWPLVAPELLERKPTSVQSDIWAMGCMLYRLLTSEWPFPSPDAIRGVSYEPPQRHNPQIPRALTRVISRALEPDLARRYSTARGMLGDLARCRAECSWTSCADDGSVEAWTTTIDGAEVAARLVPAPRGSFEVEVTIDKGSSPRRAQPNQRFSSEAQARNRLATILRNGVEGKPLR
jgi:eukaryotic-like serine/threonine-protein kinase